MIPLFIDREAPRISPWLGALLVLALWATARPYAGLRHDGVLYLGQALLHLQPDVMQRDLFFTFGSQDRFTIFARLMAQLYAHATIPVVQVIVLTGCHALLLAGTWRLLSTLAPNARWLGLCAVAVLSHQYGGHGIFAFAERFVSARTLAEPLGLLALATLLAGRQGLALLALLATGLIHPLVAAGVAVVGWCWLVIGDRRWAWTLGLLVVPVGLGAAGIAPLDQLFRRYDDEWWASVNLVSGHLLLKSWNPTDWWIVVFDALVIASSALLHRGELARLGLAVLVASALLVATSAVAGDIGHNVLVVQLQLWRVLWLPHLLALALLPALFVTACGRGVRGWVVALALAGATIAVYARWPAAGAFVAALVGAAILHRRAPPLPDRTWRLLVGAAGTVVLALAAVVLLWTYGELQLTNHDVTHLQLALLAVTMPILSLPAAGWVMSLSIRRGAAAVAALAGTVLLAAYGCTHWDRRTWMLRAVEDGWQRSNPFGVELPADAQVFWWKHPAATWVLLKRPSYWSVPQGAGLPFNRKTAVEFERRRKIFGALEMQEEVCRMSAQLNGGDGSDLSDCMPTREVMQRICRAKEGPDYLIFERRLEGAMAQWTVEAPAGARPETWYLYDCIDLR